MGWGKKKRRKRRNGWKGDREGRKKVMKPFESVVKVTDLFSLFSRRMNRGENISKKNLFLLSLSLSFLFLLAFLPITPISSKNHSIHSHPGSMKEEKVSSDWNIFTYFSALLFPFYPFLPWLETILNTKAKYFGTNDSVVPCPYPAIMVPSFSHLLL